MNRRPLTGSFENSLNVIGGFTVETAESNTVFLVAIFIFF
jgi:hypothetical protein